MAVEVPRSHTRVLILGDARAPLSRAGLVVEEGCDMQPPDIILGMQCGGAAAWMFARLPGEDAETSDGALTSLLDELDGHGDDVAAVAVRRAEPSATGTRLSWSVRAWRPGRVRAAGDWPEPHVEVRGRVVRSGVVIEADRARWTDLPGRAERFERAGEWLHAAQAWDLEGQAEGARAGYARVRAALALGKLRPGAPLVRDRLGEAIAACPALPEAYLRLAAWWLGHGHVYDALACAALADAVPEPLPDVAHLDGTGSWLVSSRMAGWLAGVDADRAAMCARMALARGVPEPMRGKLRELAGTQVPAEEVKEDAGKHE